MTACVTFELQTVWHFLTHTETLAYTHAHCHAHCSNRHAHSPTGTRCHTSSHCQTCCHRQSCTLPHEHTYTRTHASARAHSLSHAHIHSRPLTHCHDTRHSNCHTALHACMHTHVHILPPLAHAYGVTSICASIHTCKFSIAQPRAPMCMHRKTDACVALHSLHTNGNQGSIVYWCSWTPIAMRVCV